MVFSHSCILEIMRPSTSESTRLMDLITFIYFVCSILSYGKHKKCEYLCVSEIFSPSMYRCCIYCDEMRERELSDPLLLGKMNFVFRNIHK